MPIHPTEKTLRQFIEEELSPEEELRVDAHLQSCPDCATEVARLCDEVEAGAELELIRAVAAVPGNRQEVAVAAHNGKPRSVHPQLALTRDFVPSSTQPFPSVPGYEILNELGRGGMGVVYQARQTGLGRLVALKMILNGVDAATDDLNRFRNEAELIARSRHPHIVQIYEVGEHAGQTYLSLELCEGGGLDKQLAVSPLGAQEAARMVEKLAHGMQVAHDKGVIHRDLKPANVLLNDEGEPKITDFGLAKKLGETGKTLSGTVMGTPPYMAPEQARGDKELGPACDIYALGALLYESLTARPPFCGANTLETLTLVCSGKAPVALRDLQPSVPRDLETICLKCLRFEPAQRYASARELAEDLRRFLDGRPILARPTSRWERSVKWVRRYPAIATLLGTVAAAVVLASVGWWNAKVNGDESNLKREEADKARDEAKATAIAEEKARKQADRLAAGGLLAEAFARYNVNDSNGLVYHVKALEKVPADATDLERVIRSNLRDWLGVFSSLESNLQGQDDLLCAAMSLDGKFVVTGGWKKKIRLWDVATGKQVKPDLVHPSEITALALSHDGAFVVAGGSNGTVRLWKAATGQALGDNLNSKGTILMTAFSPSGDVLVTASADGTAQLWSTATGTPIGEPLQHPGPVEQVAFSPDGKLLGTGCIAGVSRLWDVQTGKQVGPDLRFSGPIESLCFSPNGKLILVGSADRKVGIWFTATGTAFGEVLHLDDEVHQVAFSPDGELFMTGGRDRKTRLWHTSNQEEYVVLNYSAHVHAAAFSPCGKFVVTGSCDRTIRFWRIETGEQDGAPLVHQGEVRNLAFSADGKVILASSVNGCLSLWDATTRKQLHTPAQTSSPNKPRGRMDSAVSTMSFSPDRKQVVIGDVTGKVSLHKMDDPQAIWEAEHEATVRASSFSPDGSLIATASMDKTIRYWQTSNGRSTGSTLKFDKAACFVCFYPCGTKVLTGCMDGTFRSFEVATGREVGKGFRHTEPTALTLSADGSRAVTASNDGSVRLWKPLTGDAVGAPLPHPQPVGAVAISPDLQKVLTGSLDGMPRLWDLNAADYDTVQFFARGPITAVAFSSDGHTFAISAAYPHGNGMQRDGVSTRGIAMVADVATKQMLAKYNYFVPLGAVAFMPAQPVLFAGGADGAVQRWVIPTPMQGSAERLTLQVQVLTGKELDDNGKLRTLDERTRAERRARLDQLGGALKP